MSPRLTNRRKLGLQRDRARRMGLPASFLHETVRAEFDERLQEVNRTFTRPAVVTGFPELWQDYLSARVVLDEDVLDLEPGAHDLVLHVLGLHWADDPVGQLVQCRRALAPDGLMLAVTLGGQTLHQLRRVLAEAESRLTDGLSPRVAPMAEIRDLGGLLQRAGLALPVADTRSLDVHYTSARHLMRDLRAMGETNALAARNTTIPSRQFFGLADSLYAEHFPAPDDRIAATFELIFLSGWAPAEGQQKPLRPGSAAARLADALGTVEIGAGEDTTPGRN